MTISNREKLYLIGLANGKTYAQIAVAENCRPSTVASGLQSVYFKLGVHKGSAAVAEAIKRGIIAPVLICTVLMGLFEDQTLVRTRVPRRPTTISMRIRIKE